MIIEITSLHVDPHSIDQFETALPEALGIIRCADGYVSHHVEKFEDDPCRYYLTVQWKDMEHAIDRFRESGRLAETRYLLLGSCSKTPQSNYYSEFDLDLVNELTNKANRAVMQSSAIA